MGGIQSYLWELWRRLPPGSASVLTTPHPDSHAFDRDQPFTVERVRSAVMLPTPALVRTIRQTASRTGAKLVVLDPVLPLGLVGPRLGLPYAVVVHGAEVSVPGRLPGVRALMAQVLRGAVHVIAAGEWVRAEAERAAGRVLSATVVPPGVDVGRFRPLDPAERLDARASVGAGPDDQLVVCLTRLVPRKGVDVLVAAARVLAPDHPHLRVVVAGSGRDRPRLERLVRATGAPVTLLGPVDEDHKPAVMGAADVFAMPCRRRWAGLEQEGFGIVFVEAAACGVPQVAGHSGGAAEAVEQGRTGAVVRRPADPEAVAAALRPLLDDAGLRDRTGRAARQRACTSFDYDLLAGRLAAAVGAR